jgi:hypothetical protein
MLELGMIYAKSTTATSSRVETSRASRILNSSSASSCSQARDAYRVFPRLAQDVAYIKLQTISLREDQNSVLGASLEEVAVVNLASGVISSGGDLFLKLGDNIQR